MQEARARKVNASMSNCLDAAAASAGVGADMMLDLYGLVDGDLVMLII